MADFDPNLERWKADIQFGLEGHRSVVAFATAALKSITLANGAAALALLAFIGHVVASRTVLAERVVDSISWPMTIFSVGVACGILATATSYLAQVFFTEVRRDDGRGSSWGNVFRVVAVLISGAGIGCFIWGIVASGNAFGVISEWKDIPEVIPKDLPLGPIT